MRKIGLAFAVVVRTSLLAFAQKAEIEAFNAKWIEFSDKGDFAGGARFPKDVVENMLWLGEGRK